MLCDQCQGVEVTVSNRRHLFIRVTSQRVATIRAWVFCSEVCRDAWWAEATTDDFLPIRTPADLGHIITKPDGSDLSVYVGGPRRQLSASGPITVSDEAVSDPAIVSRGGHGDPQILTLTMSTTMEFSLQSSTKGPLGTGLFEGTTEKIARVVTFEDGVPFLKLRLGAVPLRIGDVVTIDYRGNQAPPLFDDPAAADGAPGFDRDLNVDVFRQTINDRPTCVEALTHRRPAAVNVWWKEPPDPAELPIQARPPVTPRGPKRL